MTQPEYSDATSLAGGASGTFLTELISELGGDLNAYLESAAAAQANDARMNQGLAIQPGPDVAGINYQRFSHLQLHSMVNNNIDPSGTGENGAAWTSVGTGYSDSADNLTRLVGTSESMWQGTSGDAARQVLTQMASWLGTTGQGAQATGNHLSLQSDAAATAKNAMPDPVVFDMQAAVQSLLTGGPDSFNQNLAQQAHAAEEARQHAIQAVQTYDGSLGHTAGEMPAFAAPPEFSPASATTTGGAGSAAGSVGHGPVGAVRPPSSGGLAPGHQAGTGWVPPGQLQLSNAPWSPPAPPTPTPTPTPTPPPGDPGPGWPPVEVGPPTPAPVWPTPPGDGGGATGGYPGEPGLGSGAGEQARGGFGRERVGRAAAGAGSGRGSGSGRETGAGAATAEEAAIERGATAGRPGSAGAPGVAGMGQRGKKDEDKEHKSAEYLKENNDHSIWTDGIPRVSPPTLGA